MGAGSDILASLIGDPVAFVRHAFGAEPDPWQAKALALAESNPRVALSACKGPGKSCLMAWWGWYMLATHIDAQGIAVSITADNLRDGLWKELAVWYAKSEWLRSVFRVGKTRIESRTRPDTWWLSARSFPKSANIDEQADAIAGLHAETVFVMLDEIGSYPPGVLPAAEGIFANEEVAKARLLVSGNPTSITGPLYDIVHNQSAYWQVVHITGDPDDPMRSPRISVEWARGEIAKWGRDNPWVRVNVLGLFPLSASDKMIGAELVQAAMQRDVKPSWFSDAPRIWGFDAAMGGDGGDEIALARRQGVVTRRLMVWRGLKPQEQAEALSRLLGEADQAGEPVDLLCIDVGGGGHEVAAWLRTLGWGEIVRLVDFGSKASDGRYENKRVEMYTDGEQWLKDGGCLPQDPQLKSELIEPGKSFEIVGKRTVLRMESKKKMRLRGVKSPNRADAWALTFAFPVSPRTKKLGPGSKATRRRARAKTEYNPYAR